MEMKKKIGIKLKRYCPPILWIALAWALISVGIMITARSSTQAADALNHWYGGAVRIGMAYLTMWMPFSAAEGLLLFSPVLLAVLIGIAVWLSKKGMRASIRYIFTLVAVILIIYSLYVPGLGIGYHESTLSEKLGLPDEAVSAKQLAETMDWMIAEANALCDDVDFAFEDRSYMPFEDYDAMCEDLMTGYERFRGMCPSFYSFRSKVKPVILSDAMSYTHITGIYTFFTGESNLNIEFPDYTLPFTAAHELAHQRGFAREKEANFAAFLVCLNSPDAYSRYSGYVNMIEYFSNALYSADKNLWNAEMAKLDRRIRGEMNAYSRFYEKYRENKAAKVSDKINDSYLRHQGQTAGVKSYGLVVDLTVAYYENRVRNAE